MITSSGKKHENSKQTFFNQLNHSRVTLYTTVIHGHAFFLLWSLCVLPWYYEWLPPEESLVHHDMFHIFWPLIIWLTVFICTFSTYKDLGLYSLRRRRLTGIGIPMINLRRSSDRLRFIMGIPILIRQRLLSKQRPRPYGPIYPRN